MRPALTTTLWNAWEVAIQAGVIAITRTRRTQMVLLRRCQLSVMLALAHANRFPMLLGACGPWAVEILTYVTTRVLALTQKASSAMPTPVTRAIVCAGPAVAFPAAL